MGDNKDYKDLIILGIVAIGISVAWFAYLVYREGRDREVREKERCVQPLNQLSNNQLSNLNTLSPLTQTEIPIRNQPVYDERLYQLLENQQSQLEDINSNINNLKSLNLNYGQYGQYKISSLNNVNKLSKAGSITSIRTSSEDKTRQKEFGMI